jgi:ABC-2 type transport system ATP-binding protein
MSAVEVRDLMIAYGARTLLDDVSFDVRAGEVFGIIGPNGAGKTSLVESIAGLRTPARGLIRVACDRIGVQLQDSQLPSRVTVDEVTRLFHSFYAESRSVSDVLDSVGLSELRRAKVDRLSGGERQRLAVALALLGDPELLCLDELSTGLDPHGRAAICDMVTRLSDDGITIILTSHYMDEVERLCSRIGLLRDGGVVVSESPRAFVASAGCPHRFAIILPGLDPDAVADLRALPTVSDVDVEPDRVAFRAHWPAVADPLEAVITKYRVSPLHVRHEPPSLEEAFMRLTEARC